MKRGLLHWRAATLMPTAATASIARRRVLETVAALVAGVQLALAIIYWRVMSGELHMNDFGKFYYSARAFLEGGDMYGPTVATAVPFGPDATREFWNMNPPHFHLLVLPLAVLSPPHALGVWFGASVFCLVFSILLIARELGIAWTPRTVFYAILAVLLPSATGMVVLTAQLTFLLLLPMTIAWIAARRGNWSRAGILLGLVVSVKPFLGLFWLYCVVRRRAGAALLMAAVVAAVTLAGLVVFGVTPYLSWLRVTSGVDWHWVPMNASLAALLSRVITVNPIYEPLVDASALFGTIAATVAAIALAVTGTAIIRRRGEVDEDWGFAAVITAALLVSPLGWMYYLPLAAAPLAAMALNACRHPAAGERLVLILALPGLLISPIVVGFIVDPPWAVLTIGSIYTWTMLLLWLAVVLRPATPRRAPANP
jgi:hypothetical protein